MEEISGRAMRPRRRVNPRVSLAAGLGLAAAVLLATVIGLRPTTAGPASSPGRSGPAPTMALLDPTPAFDPVTRFVTDTLYSPVRGQIDSLVDDTRRATNLVVGCLPFTSRGG
jgi:hypothetical protein